MKKCDGFTLVELLIVVTIIGILASISVPSYIGLQERGRKGSMLRTSNTNEPELQGWINAVKKAGTLFGTVREVDSNGDGVVDGADMNNNTLSTSGMVQTFIATKSEISPWDSTIPLWNNGGVTATPAACDTVAAANPGQVTLCYTPAENQSIRLLFLSVSDRSGSIIYSKTVSAD